MIPLLLGGTESEKREHAQAIHTLDFIKLHNTAGQLGQGSLYPFCRQENSGIERLSTLSSW